MRAVSVSSAVLVAACDWPSAAQARLQEGQRYIESALRSCVEVHLVTCSLARGRWAQRTLRPLVKTRTIGRKRQIVMH